MNRAQLELLREWVRAEIWSAIASHDEAQNDNWNNVSMMAEEEEKHDEARRLFEKASLAIAGCGFAFGRLTGVRPVYTSSLQEVSGEVK